MAAHAWTSAKGSFPRYRLVRPGLDKSRCLPAVSHSQHNVSADHLMDGTPISQLVRLIWSQIALASFPNNLPGCVQQTAASEFGTGTSNLLSALRRRTQIDGQSRCQAVPTLVGRRAAARNEPYTARG